MIRIFFGTIFLFLLLKWENIRFLVITCAFFYALYFAASDHRTYHTLRLRWRSSKISFCSVSVGLRSIHSSISQLPNFITKCHKYTSFYYFCMCLYAKIIVKLYHYIRTKRTQNRVLFVLFNWFVHHKIIVAPYPPGQSHYCHYFSVCMCLLLTKLKCHIIHIIVIWNKLCLAIYKII